MCTSPCSNGLVNRVNTSPPKPNLMVMAPVMTPKRPMSESDKLIRCAKPCTAVMAYKVASQLDSHRRLLARKNSAVPPARPAA